MLITPLNAYETNVPVYHKFKLMQGAYHKSGRKSPDMVQHLLLFEDGVPGTHTNHMIPLFAT